MGGYFLCRIIGVLVEDFDSGTVQWSISTLIRVVRILGLNKTLGKNFKFTYRGLSIIYNKKSHPYSLQIK